MTKFAKKKVHYTVWIDARDKEYICDKLRISGGEAIAEFVRIKRSEEIPELRKEINRLDEERTKKMELLSSRLDEEDKKTENRTKEHNLEVINKLANEWKPSYHLGKEFENTVITEDMIDQAVKIKLARGDSVG